MYPVPRLKVCCISSHDEARWAIEAGADAIGLVSSMPSGPGVIAESLIAEIAESTPPHIATFLLTSLTDAAAIAEQHSRCRTRTIQLVDRITPDELKLLRHFLPGVELVQVIHVGGPESIGEAVAASSLVDALLLDSGRPAAAVKELGGTGRVHDWAQSAQIVSTVGKPVFLAGGLNAQNVPTAIASVRPHGLDVCSGVRENGLLNLSKLQAFVSAMRMGG